MPCVAIRCRRGLRPASCSRPLCLSCVDFCCCILPASLPLVLSPTALLCFCMRAALCFPPTSTDPVGLSASSPQALLCAVPTRIIRSTICCPHASLLTHPLLAAACPACLPCCWHPAFALAWQPWQQQPQCPCSLPAWPLALALLLAASERVTEGHGNGAKGRATGVQGHHGWC